MNFSKLMKNAANWRRATEQLKAKHRPEGFTWYGYDILANTHHLTALLSRVSPDPLASLRKGVVADIGCADGDLGYYLADNGFEVDLIDWPATNWNDVRGARYLGQLLRSSARVHEVDLDSQFTLPRAKYDLVLLLGILYHLKNPFYVLEKIAKHTRYCIISTRVARLMGGVDMSAVPVAYLVGPAECNDDATNYWMFSVKGLHQIIERAGFRAVAFMTVGDTAASNPAEPQHDERAFVLLESEQV